MNIAHRMIGLTFVCVVLFGVNAHSQPVDVDGDGMVGPLELIDVTLNWHSDAVKAGADKAPVISNELIHLSGAAGSRLILDINPDNINFPRGIDMKAEIFMGDPRGWMAVKGTGGLDTIRLDGRAGSVSSKRVFVGDNIADVPIELNGGNGRVRGTFFQLGRTGPLITNVDDVIVAMPNLNVGSMVRVEGSIGNVQAQSIQFGNGGPQITRVGNRIRVPMIEMSGADLSEKFNVQTGDLSPEPGMVLAIDPDSPGDLRIADKAYDTTVAGILSGAGGVRPGILMGQPGTLADGEFAVALSGRVYCLVDADVAPIHPGDLLTTSHVPGHAMKVEDHTRAPGAILGKALTSLSEGRGLVLVLVSLQ